MAATSGLIVLPLLIGLRGMSITGGIDAGSALLRRYSIQFLEHSTEVCRTVEFPCKGDFGDAAVIVGRIVELFKAAIETSSVT